MFGMTFLTPPKHSELFVYLNYSIVEPLLRDDLTSSERMGCEWFFANVLIHEMAVSKSVARVNKILLICLFSQHAFWQAEHVEHYPNHSSRAWEPYFQDDVLAELGYSMETAVR